MDGLFLGILNLSLYGSFAIVAVLKLRFFLKKSPSPFLMVCGWWYFWH